MKVLNWNVAGIRACYKKDGLSIVNNYDIVCFQETKCEKFQFPQESLFPEFKYKYWHATKGRKGFHGTSIWSKEEPVSVVYGLPCEYNDPTSKSCEVPAGNFDPTSKSCEVPAGNFDQEGRVITAQFPEFTIVTVYTPNSKADLSRLPERVNEWDTRFRNYVNSIPGSVVLCGDFNVAHLDLDIYNPQGHSLSAGFTDPERTSFSKLLETFTDIHRYMYPKETGHFTFWPYTVKIARSQNLGWRLDYFLVSKDLIEKVKKVGILQKHLGSDHCPIEIELC